MRDEWTDRLSEYLDGDLDGAEREALERHLGACESCTVVVRELTAVRDRAAGLVDRGPAQDLWPGIAERLGPRVVDLAARRRARRVVFSVPQLAAAGIALMAVSAGGAWLATRLAESGATATIPQPTSAYGMTAVTSTGNPGYDAAVRDLQLVLETSRGALDSATVHVLEASLAAIDAAIAQAREALARDPANEYLNAHLVATMWQKVHLLRRAVALAGA